ncbi:MAG: DUF6262 family protein [Actinomycetota bacterium]|jgi:septal ring factor EnvC (AmiA/AmiB activator)|nr:DUF6262 family protein [Actinomycetota bacterium]MDQ3527486.1 DUF6262 family protein [Actinomycetota bacterium]
MTSTDPRTERLVANRRVAAAEKQARALATIERMVERGARVTFIEVQRAAKVSTWFVYNNPAIRQAIESAIREQHDHHAGETTNPLDDRTLPGLRTELANTRAEIRDLREERDRLRRRLQRDLGDQIDAHSRRELLERLRVLEQESSQLRDTLGTTTAELATTKRERDTAVADLEGTQLALRQTIRPVATVR